jgi:ElaB/YqjD/DUF883 family membrane-anchored ribosome-binding protein
VAPVTKLARIDRGEQSVADVRRELDESRQRLASSADSLRSDVRESVSDLRRGAHELKERLYWKNWVAKHPWGFVLGAVAVGVFLGRRNRS